MQVMYRKIRRKIDSVGGASAVLFIARRFFDSLVRSGNLFFRCDLSLFDPDKFVNSGIRIQEKKAPPEITGPERNVLDRLGGTAAKVEFAKRMERGDRLFFAYINGELAGLCWVNFAGGRSFYSIPLSDSIPLSEKSFMLMSGYTLDQFRKKGVSTTLLGGILSVMKQEGYAWAFGVTTGWNFNRKTLLKLGFRLVARFHEFSIGGRNILIWTPQRRSTTDRDP